MYSTHAKDESTSSTVVNGQSSLRPSAIALVNSYSSGPTVVSPEGSTFNLVQNGGHQIDEIIPPVHEHRTLVLCFDGTGDQFDADNSNIVQFFSMLKKDDRTEQMVYYQAGIGTYTIPEIATPTYAEFSKTLDMMVAIYLNAHVMGGYEFLMENYQAGDKICIFGFSRGAYTARALAGMIHKVGLLPASNHQQVPFAYKMYTTDTEEGWKQSGAFKKAFCMDVDIEFLGTWDTVNSVGIIPHYLPFIRSNTHVRYFRHALSLDERRVRFRPALWAVTRAGHNHLGVKRGEMPRPKKKENPEKHRAKEHERSYSVQDVPTDVEEVWFSGCHCDVGGGSVMNGTRHSLARIPLRWMIRQCFLCDTGIMFHRDMFKCVGLDPATLYPIVKPRPPPVVDLPLPITLPDTTGAGAGALVPDGHDFVSEEVEDFMDSLAPIYDQLAVAPMWWILEVIPFQKDGSTWKRFFSINRGDGRPIPRQHADGVKLHRAVKHRMEAEFLINYKGQRIGTYTPRAHLKVEPTWVS